MKYLLGIDDTDTIETRGTGFHARQMAARIEEEKLGTVYGITRHQNYVHPDIPYTSQNSSACLLVESVQPGRLKVFCRNFLLEIAPDGSDIGICMANDGEVHEEIESWGQRAKCEGLTKAGARELALKPSLYLEGLNGTHDGIIGALAAVGLRASGNDGRFIWLKKKRELRELPPGFINSADLRDDFGVQQLLMKSGETFLEDEEIFIHEWFRPVLRDNKVTLIIEKFNDNGKYFWKAASKDYIRANS
jgi:hypothetical protein